MSDESGAVSRQKDERAPVVVAMSGGVDSSTAAALLVEAGERVIGIAMRLYDAEGTSSSSGGRCCGPRDLEDARRVAAHLGIPFYVANYQESFHEAVIADFVAEYVAGRTPNPCVQCNTKVKFLPLLRRAQALGASALVTGHYARIVDGPSGPALARARDAGKDQSYFLFGMPRSALPWVRFPLGDMTKEEVRAHARRLGLPNADKPESMEICFIPDGDHAGFVALRTPSTALRPGPVVDQAGAVLGQHDGIHRFTVGQRRGLGRFLTAPAAATAANAANSAGAASGAKTSGASPVPLYVTGLDPATGAVVVGERAQLERSEMTVEEVVWWGPPASAKVAVQIRHRHAPRSAEVEPLDGGKARVRFDEPERAIAPGQAAVFYDGERIVGGGFIASA